MTLGSWVKTPTLTPPTFGSSLSQRNSTPNTHMETNWTSNELYSNYHVKANPTLTCYNEIHFVSTHLYLLRDRNTPGKVPAWRKHCSHAGSRTLPAQLQCLLPTAGGRLPAARCPGRAIPAPRGSGFSSGMLGGACPVPVHVGVRRGGTLRGDNALLCCGGCQRHREALGGQRGKVLSPVGFAQWEIIAVTQTVAFQNKQPQWGESRCGDKRGEGWKGWREQDRSKALRKWQKKCWM